VEIVEDTKNPSGLSEFFSALSKEKNETRQKIKENIANPETGLSGLFQQLEEALQETQKVSVEEIPDNTRLSTDDQNKLEVFSNLLNTLDSDKEIPIKVEPIDFVEELEPEEIIPEELVVESEELHEIIEPQDEIIASVIRNLDDMKGKTQVKEEVDQISSIRKEFDNFRSLIAQQIASSQMSGAGSGEVRLEFLDDVDRDTAKVNDKALVYDSSSGKWKGETILTSAITGLDIDGGTDIGAALVDADLFIVDDGAGGTNRKTAASRIKTYVADITLTTAAQGNVTSLGTLTALTVDDVVINGATIGHGDDTDLITVADGVLTVAGELDAATLDISGNADIDGTLEADAYTVDGTALNEYIADTIGAMVGSNTETGITVSYQDGDNTLDFVVGTLNQDTTGTAATVTTAAQPNITSLGTLSALQVDNININGNAITSTAGTDLTITPLSGQQIVLDSAIVVDAGVVTGATSITSTVFVGDITGDVTGNVSGTAATVTGAAQSAITSLGTLTTLTVDNIVINGANIGHTSDTDALAIDSSGNVTASQNLIVSGNFTVNGTTTTVSSTNTVIADNLFELNNGAGSNSNDSGIIIERGSTGDNAIIMWDESADKFQVGTTTATASATGNLSVTSGILVASSFEGNLASAVIENSGQITSDSFNLPITLNGTNGSSANAGDNIVQDTAANANDRIVYEDSTPTHYERPITWDRTT